MHIATIIPIARGIPFDTLSYYASEALAPGTLVSIPFGKQTIVGIVLSTIPLIEAKSIIKQSSFSLKKVTSVITTSHSCASIALAVQDTGALTLAPVGAIAASVIPQSLFEYINAEKLPTGLAPLTDEPSHVFREDIVIGFWNDRLDRYKRLVRTAFAEHHSVLFVAPTIRTLELWKSQLEKGIGKHVITLHSKLTKKVLRSQFALLKSTERPVVIFATPGFATIPRADIRSIVVEDESSSLYKTHDRFGIDLRTFLARYAFHNDMHLYWGDCIPRFETLERLGQSHLPRSFVPDKLHVVPVDTYRTVLPSEVMDLVRHAEKKKARLFIYTNRKGVAPLSRCNDCSTLVTCPECTLPMVLRNKVLTDGNKVRSFVCTHCAATLPATHICSNCGSWNISPLSIGTESIRDEIISLVGEEAVITIDDDLAPDSSTVETLLEYAQKRKFSIVIGTIKVLPYLKNIEYTIIPFFDRLLSAPSIYTTEDALRTVMAANERSSEAVIVCTRTPSFPFLKQLETQKINGVITDELALRKELGYPPYGSLIKISLTVPEGHRQGVVERMKEFFTDREVMTLPGRRIEAGSMKVLLTWMLKAETTYIEEEGPTLAAFLTTLRFPYKIEQNPERL